MTGPTVPRAITLYSAGVVRIACGRVMVSKETDPPVGPRLPSILTHGACLTMNSLLSSAIRLQASWTNRSRDFRSGDRMGGADLRTVFTCSGAVLALQRAAS